MKRADLIIATTLFTIRLFHLYVVRSWYVPDEYWQSLEVAHNITFGFGYRTWEWLVGIRSYISISWIILLYKSLKFFSMDTLQLLIWSPRFLQTLFTTYSDYCFVRWMKTHSKCSNILIPVMCYMTCPFLAYCSTRTLVNTLETNLTSVALYYYPWLLKNKDTKFLWIVSLVCIMRPTAIIVWLPLILFDMFAHKRYMLINLTRYIIVGLTSIIFSILIDSYFHGSFVVTQWNFVYYNIFQKVNEHYSIEHWSWYLFSGLPTVLGPIFIILVYVFIKELRRVRLVDTSSKLMITVIWTLFVFSVIPHKEQRFLLPLFPMIFFITSNQICETGKKFKKSGYFIAIINTFILIYLGRYHQIGSTNIMKYLATVPQNSSLLFLLPCHSTPLYSHLHSNITTRILTCEPNLHGVSNYVDEADVFFRNPTKWLEESFSSENNMGLPTHLIMFDELSHKIQTFLAEKKYKNVLTTFHTHFPSGRIGRHLIVYSTSRHINNFKFFESSIG